MITLSGPLAKMRTSLDEQGVAQYRLELREGHQQPLNQMVGQRLKLHFVGQIRCIHCQRSVKKTFNQGYCFPCSQSLAACDLCIVRPERCHFAKGTCREPEWGQQHCFIPHTVYLANSSGLKVGITRSHHLTSRWIDQGATQAVALAQVQNRLHAGLIEVELGKLLADKTDWRKMLRQNASPLDLKAIATEHQARLASAAQAAGIKADLLVPDPYHLSYPILQYPQKITSLSLDKTPTIEATLWGIKGQYLILDSGVFNLRKHAGYWVEITASNDLARCLTSKEGSL